MKTKRIAELAVACVVLAGCWRSAREELKGERADKAYQAAIADYTAGRIDAAVDGFESAVKSDPGNASARFQLAVLLQDSRRDYLGAICCYREYLMLAPGSDKVTLARERMAVCEKLLASEYAGKYNLSDATALMKDIDKLKADVDRTKALLVENTAKLEERDKRVRSLEQENDQLKALLRRMRVDDDGSAPPARRVAKEEAPSRPATVVSAEAASLMEEAGGPVRVNPEALRLFAEERGETAPAPAQPEPEAQAAAPAAPAPEAEAAEAPAAPREAFLGPRELAAAAAASATASAATTTRDGQRLYTVQEGETLSVIAQKFYGRKSAWKDIQKANKATVSSDGNVKAGQVLVIP